MNRAENTEVMIKTEAFVVSPKKTFPAGAIIFPKNGGAIFTEKKRYLISDSVIDLNTEAIVANDSVIKREYLYYLLSHVKISSFDNGGGLPSINIKKMADFDVLVPPLSEQQKIVDYLDNAFEKIDQLKKNAEQQLSEAKALFQASLKSLLEPKDGWEEKKIEEICKSITAGKDAPKGYFSKFKTKEFQIPIYANAAENDGLYGYTKYSTINERCVTIAARGSGTGLVIKRTIPFVPIVRLIVAIPYENIIIVDYLFHYLTLINIKSSGSAIPQLTIPMIKDYRIHYPTLSEQQAIVDTLDAIKFKVDQLKSNYDKICKECDALKQAILRDVFE